MEPASFETGDPFSSPARCEGANPKLATGRPECNSVGIVPPPYWQRHERNASYLSTYSADNGRPTPIGLEDHTDEGSDHCKVLWAKGVTIDDYVVVGGTAPGLGSYVVWNCTVETLDVSFPSRIERRASMQRRYSLVQSFAGNCLPKDGFMQRGPRWLGDCSLSPE
jgi:hypothetical protein